MITQHLTLVEVIPEGNLLIKRFTADDPFHFRNHDLPIEEIELVYDFDSLVCEVFMNPELGSNLNGDSPDGTRFMLNTDYPESKTDKMIFEEAVQIRALISKEVEELSEELEFAY